MGQQAPGRLFYSPSMDMGGNLGGYLRDRDYLDFSSKALDPASGFWVNHP